MLPCSGPSSSLQLLIDQLVETWPVHPGCFPTSTDQPRDSKNSRKCGWTILEDSMFFRIWNNQQHYGKYRRLQGSSSLLPTLFKLRFNVTNMVCWKTALQQAWNPRTLLPAAQHPPVLLSNVLFYQPVSLPLLSKPVKWLIKLLEMAIWRFIHSLGISHKTVQHRICISTKCNMRISWSIFTTKLRGNWRRKMFYHYSPAHDIQRFRLWALSYKTDFAKLFQQDQASTLIKCHCSVRFALNLNPTS